MRKNSSKNSYKTENEHLSSHDMRLALDSLMSLC